ncbi:MAG: hypothetical protein KME60_07220 [Cyanomargarita calcarea GSE-NOS-MK-12-04C]|uniref:Uncharacterized protein n=1 Tax=Cyanomargarita calcarea GSE-NOS-MK-12-04C TaxID=2839659 RepID=A0A951QJ13_9CYAN|nr:hypothetical protein [Cyanomargarita calcarea GSE-NOS-MK-12-04C]
MNEGRRKKEEGRRFIYVDWNRSTSAISTKLSISQSSRAHAEAPTQNGRPEGQGIKKNSGHQKSKIR